LSGDIVAFNKVIKLPHGLCHAQIETAADPFEFKYGGILCQGLECFAGGQGDKFEAGTGNERSIVFVCDDRDPMTTFFQGLSQSNKWMDIARADKWDKQDIQIWSLTTMGALSCEIGLSDMDPTAVPWFKAREAENRLKMSLACERAGKGCMGTVSCS
jgi:hypothetical protein